MRASLFLVLVLGCDAQVDFVYPGEPLARLDGIGVGFGEGEIGDAIAVLWNANRGYQLPSGPIVLQPLRPNSPSALSVNLLTPPPEAAFFRLDDDTADIAEGYLFLVGPDAGDPVDADDFIGTALGSVIGYVRGEVEPGSLTAGFLGGAWAPGYHVLDWRATAELTGAQSHLAGRCADDMVEAGILGREAADTECRRTRLYRLVGTPADLETQIVFYRRPGGP